MRNIRIFIGAALLIALILPLALSVESSGPQPGSYSPSAAYDPSGNRFLLVFTDVDYYGVPAIYGLLVGPEATPLGSPTRISSDEAYVDYSSRPSVAFSPGEGIFLVTWHDMREGNPDIYASFVNTTAESILPEDEFTVSAGPSNATSPAAAYSPLAGGFIVAWQDDTGGDGDDIYARTLFYKDAYASIETAIYTAPSGQGEISISASPINPTYFIAFEDFALGQTDPTISGQLVDAVTLAPLTSTVKLGLDISGQDMGGYAPSVSPASTDTDEFLVAWSGPLGEIRARYIADADSSSPVFEPDGMREGPATRVRAGLERSTGRGLITWQELIQNSLHDIYYMLLDGTEVYHLGTLADNAQMDERGASVTYNSMMPSFLVAYEFTDNAGVFNVLLTTVSDPAYPAIRVEDPVWPHEDLGLEYPDILYSTAVSHTLSVYNDSTLAGLDIANITAAGPFMVSGENCTLETIAPHGDPCSVTVEFAPGVGGLASGSLSIDSNDPNEPSLKLFMRGLGLAPKIYLTGPLMAEDESVIDFGQVKVAEGRLTTITVSNNGDYALYIDALTSMDNGFEVRGDSCTMRSVMPGSFCTFGVLASPSSEGQLTGNIWIRSDDPANPAVALGLRATGVKPEPAISNRDVFFGPSAIAETSVYEVKISNPSGAELMVNDMRIHGTGFDLMEETCTQAPLDADAHCSVILGFTPMGLYGYIGSLSILAEGAEHTIELSGSGAVPIASASRTLDFGELEVNEVLLREVSITSLGQLPLEARATSITGEGLSIAYDGCAEQGPLPYATSCPITVELAPMKTGPINGTLLIETNDPDEETIAVDISAVVYPQMEKTLGEMFYGYTY